MIVLAKSRVIAPLSVYLFSNVCLRILGPRSYLPIRGPSRGGRVRVSANFCIW
jgi:hypothetical protein